MVWDTTPNHADLAWDNMKSSFLQRTRNTHPFFFLLFPAKLYSFLSDADSIFKINKLLNFEGGYIFAMNFWGFLCCSY